jgi:hypothetical protein
VLVIRQKQVEAFEAAMLQRFETEMVRHLRSTCPEHVGPMQDEDLLSFIRSGIDKAETFGITDATDVRRFLEFMARQGCDLELEAPARWAAGVLADDDLSASEKMDSLEEQELFTRRPGRR